MHSKVESKFYDYLIDVEKEFSLERMKEGTMLFNWHKMLKFCRSFVWSHNNFVV